MRSLKHEKLIMIKSWTIFLFLKMKVEVLYQTASILSIFAVLYEKFSIPVNGYPFLIYLVDTNDYSQNLWRTVKHYKKKRSKIYLKKIQDDKFFGQWGGPNDF